MDPQLQEMLLSPKCSVQLSRVKVEPPDAAYLYEQGQIQEQYCSESPSRSYSYGETAGMYHVKEEPHEDCSSEHPIVEVKTEPYNTAILAEQDQMGHRQDSTYGGARETAASLHVKDQPRGICDEESSGCTFSETPFKISAITVEPQFDSTSRVITNGRATERLQDQSEPCALVYASKDSRKHHTFAQCQNESEMCPTASPLAAEMEEEGTGCVICSSSLPALSRSSDQHIAKFNRIVHQLRLRKRACTGEKPYKCHVCPAQFTRSAQLKYHWRTHKDEKPYKCNLCPAEFSVSGNLQQHKRTHAGEKPYKCNFCPAEFRQGGHLQVHMRTHTGEKPYKCDVCPAEFTRSSYLQHHKRRHTGEKPYKCDVCPAKFSRSGHLQCHRQTHTGEKPYKCDVCHAGFSQSGSLQGHMRTHTGEKPYKCDVCPAQFRLSGHLQRHKQTHTGEKPYKCNVCPAGFSRSSDLKRHKQTHTGEKPYKCDVCPAEFSRSGHLRGHKRTHTEEKP